MFLERTSVGLDVHARSVVACAIDGVTGEITQARLCPDPRQVIGWVAALPGPCRVVYEAGPTGARRRRSAGSLPRVRKLGSRSSRSGVTYADGTGAGGRMALLVADGSGTARSLS